MLKTIRKKFIITILAVIIILSFIGCQSPQERQVVIYTSVDQVFTEEILEEFEKTTGIKVLPVFDVEATKTIGLANRLLAEKNNPKADVFWSGEFIMTKMLADEGVLASYKSPSAEDIPENFKDPDGYWTGYAGRARILLVNKNLLTPDEYPNSIHDLLNSDRDPAKIGLAYPLFGTTRTHAAAIYAYMGPDEGKKFFEKIKERGVRIFDGNSVVRDMVVSGQLAIGLTDTDDACVAVRKGEPVEIIIPDQDNIGAFVIPNTVALVAKGPNSEEGKQLVDFLLSKEIERKLIEIGWSHVPVRSLELDPDCMPPGSIKNMAVSFGEVYLQNERVSKELADIFIR